MICQGGRVIKNSLIIKLKNVVLELDSWEAKALGPGSRAECPGALAVNERRDGKAWRQVGLMGSCLQIESGGISPGFQVRVLRPCRKKQIHRQTDKQL